MRLQARFRKPQDALYLALREPYLRTVAPIADWTLANLDQVRNLANEILGSVRVGKTSAERLDYQIAKRCVEQAAVRCWMEQHPGRDLSAHTENLCDARYITLGLDLLEDEYEGDAPGDQQPTWTISEDAARMVVGPPGSLWEHLSDTMMRLEVAVRVGVVEQLGRYLTFQQVPFLPALLGEAADAGLSIDPVESAAMLKFLPRFWQTTTGRAWVVRFREFLEYFVHRDQHQQKAILNGPLQQIRFSRHTGESDSRERLREAFNTPLFPMVLIANEVMQEGLDLHKHCRRIVHHDLVWNPAQLEQRIGRIDRLGSLTNRLRKAGSDSTLDVLYPLIRGTIDERLFRTVKDREKWLEFLLGAPPETEVNDLGVQTHRLPEKLASDLVVDLSPHSVTEPGEGAARRPNC
jgi:hypothetical protein